jgi:hypothetical protein
VRDHPPAPETELDLVEIGKLATTAFGHLALACTALESMARMFVRAAEAEEALPSDPLAHARPPEDAAPASKPAPSAAPKTTKPQVFKTTSFWRMVDGGDIFQVAGGVDAPAKTDADFVKITRDEFNILKKAGADERSWPFSDDEPQTADDDEDDGSGLI